MVFDIQYITQGNTAKKHIQQVKEICNTNINWIQLRMKNFTYDEYLQSAFEVKNICDEHSIKLIINDNVLIAKEVNAAGVHLGQNDMSITAARKILGNETIIGQTANTFEHILANINQGANYVGLGPFKFTQTKSNLSPTLGLQGYKKIINQCKKQNINIPIIAIGGIQVEDITELINVGAYGVAISSLLTFAHDKKEVFKMLKLKIDNAKNCR